MNALANLLRGALTGGSLVALPLALVGGVVTSLNPCCLPLYPAAASACCATRGERVERAFGNALAFVIGVAVTTSFLGIVASVAGRAMVGIGGWAGYAIALVPLVMGMDALGWVRLPMPAGTAPKVTRGLAGAFATGLLLSAVLVPCGTPVLASVLSYAAHRGSVPYGATLLFAYGIGAGFPILLLGTAVGGLAARLDAKGWRPAVNRLTGIALLGLGFYLLWTS